MTTLTPKLVNKLSTTELRDELSKRDLPITGKKPTLCQRFKVFSFDEVLSSTGISPTLKPEEIDELVKEELVDELSKRNVSTSGLCKVELRKKLTDFCFEEVLEKAGISSTVSGVRIKRPSSEKDREDLKRIKMSVEAALEEYICVISHALPMDPVMAMDGEIYERSEIAKWIETSKAAGRPVTSPATRAIMGDTLLPARRVSNTIQKLIENNNIESALARAWLKSVAVKKERLEILAKAHAGDLAAMYNLARWYKTGKKGLLRDDARAMEWYKKSSDLNYPPAMALYGACLVKGQYGLEKNVPYGVSLLTSAACRGSNYACYTLGLLHREGSHGLPQDDHTIVNYLNQVADATCEYQHLASEHVVEATEWLRELESKREKNNRKSEGREDDSPVFSVADSASEEEDDDDEWSGSEDASSDDESDSSEDENDSCDDEVSIADTMVA